MDYYLESDNDGDGSSSGGSSGSSSGGTTDATVAIEWDAPKEREGDKKGEWAKEEGNEGTERRNGRQRQRNVDTEYNIKQLLLLVLHVYYNYYESVVESESMLS